MGTVRHSPSLATTVPFDVVGAVAIVDLEAACELYGRDMLPDPLGRSRPVGSVWLATREVGAIEDRLNGGDLDGIRAWVEGLVRADVCVECRISYRDERTPDLRLHGLRAGVVAFVAVQRSDHEIIDVVDIYAVAPGDLGKVVAESVGLVGAGAHARIAVAGYGDRLPPLPEMVDEYDDFGFPIPRTGPRSPAILTVEGSQVVATGTVQSRYDRALHWGVDAERPVLRWVQVGDDGDYIYPPHGAGYAEPLNVESLHAYIDRLVAEDLSVVWEGRNPN